MTVPAERRSSWSHLDRMTGLSLLRHVWLPAPFMTVDAAVAAGAVVVAIPSSGMGGRWETGQIGYRYV